jgi:hypothetical protein
MFLGTPRDQCARISLETLIRSILFGRAGCLVAASFTGTSAHFLVPAQRDAGLPRELRVASEISEAILNHAKQGMEKVYNRAEYIAQKRTALAMWADHLNSIIEGAERKVVPMRPKEVLA